MDGRAAGAEVVRVARGLGVQGVVLRRGAGFDHEDLERGRGGGEARGEDEACRAGCVREEVANLSRGEKRGRRGDGPPAMMMS